MMRAVSSNDELQLLTLGQTAAALNVSDRTVRRLAAAGHLRPVRLGSNLVRYSQVEVIELIHRCRDDSEDPIDVGLRLLGQLEQARPNPLCPRCGLRERVGTDWCGVCQAKRRAEEEEAAERARARKRRTWERHGKQYKATQRAKRESEGE